MSKSIDSDVSSSMCLRLYTISYRNVFRNLILDNIFLINRDISLTNFKVRDIKMTIFKKVKDRNIR